MGKQLIKIFFYSIVAILLPAMVIDCSPKTQHKILSLFFDGVPDLEKKQAVSSDSTAADSSRTEEVLQKIRTPQPEYIFHPPYQERSCSNCHNIGQSGRLRMPQPELCYECHDNFSEEFSSLHGPVAGGYCTGCHNPHMAKNPKLLKRTSQKLCFYCHNPGNVLKIPVHEEIGETNCTECHDPHGE